MSHPVEISAAETHGLQRKLEFAESRLQVAIEVAYAEAKSALGATAEEQVEVAVREERAEVAAARVAAEAAQEAVGGFVARIPSFKVEVLQKKVAAMAKRAAKLEVEAPSVTVTEETEVEEIKETVASGETVVTETRTWVYVVIAGSFPKLAGWVFLATLQHSEAGTIIRRIPGLAAQMRGLVEQGQSAKEASEELEAKFSLAEFRQAAPICEHCQTARARRDTYVVLRPETGEIKQVGSSCVRDFTGGRSPAEVARVLEWTLSLVELAGEAEEEGFGLGGGGRTVYETTEYLTHVATCIREYGWTARSASYSGTPTADCALSNLEDRRRNVKTQPGCPRLGRARRGRRDRRRGRPDLRPRGAGGAQRLRAQPEGLAGRAVRRAPEHGDRGRRDAGLLPPRRARDRAQA